MNIVTRHKKRDSKAPSSFLKQNKHSFVELDYQCDITVEDRDYLWGLIVRLASS